MSRRRRPESPSFVGFRFPPEVILLAVRWYLRYGLSYRDVEELLAERGVDVDHVTIYRWVQRFTPLVIEAARPCCHSVGDRWFVDETYVALGDAANTVFIDGRVTRLYGDVNGRVTLVGNEKVRVTGDLRYVDDDGDTAMLNGDDYTQSYKRNESYEGNSVLGVIARDD
ncbi:MAG: transposase, partial [Acidimicrobiales bacterium]